MNVVGRGYEDQPTNYEKLVKVERFGSSTIRNLTLVSEVTHGCQPSWRNQVRYAFAYGGKDRKPFPVDRNTMGTSLHFLRSGVEQTDTGDRVKILAFLRLIRTETQETRVYHSVTTRSFSRWYVRGAPSTGIT